MIKHLLSLAMIAALSACSSTSEKPAEPEVPPDLPVFEQGVRALDQQRYEDAAKIFDKLLVAKPASEHDLVIIFNSGAAYEGMGNCAKASERYRQVSRASAGKYAAIESQSFYRLSLMYECLGQDVKLITALLDARKRGRGLPPETLNAEIPARLAAAYARMGNKQKALDYFGIASKGLKKVIADKTGKRQTDALGQTLYLMGQLSSVQRRAEGDPVAFLQGLSMQQPYLLQAVETHHPVWSKRAAEDLETAYDNIWKYQPPEGEKQREFFVRSLQTIAELKRIRMPKDDPPVDAIFEKVDKTEARLRLEMSRYAENNKLTPEAEKREGLKREGRLIDPPKPAKPPVKKPIKKRIQ